MKKAVGKSTYTTHWLTYKKWCAEQAVHPWVNSDPALITQKAARDLLVLFLASIKPRMQSHGYFTAHKSCIVSAYSKGISIDLSKDRIISEWMAAWKKEMPPRPRWNDDLDPWDVGLIVEYWADKPNDSLDLKDLTLKASSLFAVKVYPRPSCMAKLARDRLQFFATSMRYRYFGTKELKSVPTFTAQQGLSTASAEIVCPVRTLQAYIQRTTGPMFRPDDREFNYDHVFLSMTPQSNLRLHLPVGADTCSRWLRLVMDRIGVDPRFKGGSVRMAAASKAVDEGTPIDVVLNTGRWSSWRTFNLFYNRARVRDTAPPIGCTHLPN